MAWVLGLERIMYILCVYQFCTPQEPNTERQHVCSWCVRGVESSALAGAANSAQRKPAASLVKGLHGIACTRVHASPRVHACARYFCWSSSAWHHPRPLLHCYICGNG
jgi:hypothetical protein